MPGASTNPRAADRTFNGTAFWGSTLAPNGNSTDPAEENRLYSPNAIVAGAVFAFCVLLVPAIYLMWEKRRQTRSSQEAGAGPDNQANGETRHDQGDARSTNRTEIAHTMRLVKQYIVSNSLILHAGHFFTTTTTENECCHSSSTGTIDVVVHVELENGRESKQRSDCSAQIVLHHQHETQKEPQDDSSRASSLESDQSDLTDSGKLPVDTEEGNHAVTRNVYVSNVDVGEIQQTLRKTNASSKGRVGSECAICLSSYEEGNSVVGSSNPSCAHVFHSRCIEQWLISRRGSSLGDLHCPCCRQQFLLLDGEEDLEHGIPAATQEPSSI